MPTYQYQCTKGHTFEVFQRISDRPKAKCPTCGAKATRLISGGAGLIFKGSGFYITDYGKDGKGPRKESESNTDSTPKAESTEPKSADTAKKPEKEAKPEKKAPPRKGST